MINLISNQRQIQKSDIPKVEQTYNDLFKQVTKLEKGGVICRSNCNFCNHPIRHEAEKKWEDMHRSYKSVEKLFKTWEAENPGYALVSGDKKMSDDAIRNHLLKHYAKQVERMWLKEYVTDIQEYMKYRIDLDQRFEMLSAVFEKQLFDIGSAEDLDTIKQSDQLVKIGKMIIEIQDCQVKLRGDLKPVNVMQEKLANVWFHIISNEQDQKVKTRLVTALDIFQEHVQGGGGLTVE